MKKPNCWEFMRCGKGPSRDGKGKCNSCPVANNTSANGLNSGINGGRICWIIAESCDNGKVQIEEGLLNICKATGQFLDNTS